MTETNTDDRRRGRRTRYKTRRPGEPWWKRKPPGPRGAAMLLVALWLAATPARADDGLPGGLFLETPAGWSRAPALASEAAIDIAGMVARVEIRQSFTHDGPGPVEGVYVFPLPVDAAVDTLELRIGGRRILGEIRERGEAREAYRRARSEGRRAGLVEQERPNLFSLSVANLPPGEPVHVHIGYFQRAELRGGRFSLGLPLTVTPRCLPARPTGDGAVAEPPAVAYRAAQDDPGLGLSVRLRGGLEIDGVDFGAAAMTAHVAGGADVVEYVPAGGRVPMDRDFRMSWSPRLGLLPEAAIFSERFGDDEFALVMLVPPHADTVVTRPREIILVIDTSGSMAGDPIRQARSALARAIGRLGPQDRFNVIEFNSETRALFRGVVPADDRHRRAAADYVRSLEADGGTVMAPAIELALDGADGQRLRQVVFVTDGAVGDEEALFALIRQRLGPSRLFTVAIGGAPNEHFMTQAAHWGRGTHVRIGDLSEVGERMDGLFAMLERPALTDIVVTFPELPETEIWPRRIPDLYAGEPVMVAARLPRGRDARPPRLRLEGRSEGGHWLRQLALPPGEDAPGVAAVWARAKIGDLERRLLERGDPDALRSEIVDVALTYGLVSRYTSLVAVDATPAAMRGTAGPTRRIPLVAPNGADGIRLGAITATATASRQLLARGALLIVVALLLLAFDPRRSPRWD